MKKPELTMKQNLTGDMTGNTKKWHGLLDCAMITFYLQLKKNNCFKKLYLFSVVSINHRIAPITRSLKPCFLQEYVSMVIGWRQAECQI